MSVRCKASVFITFHYVSDFSRHPQILYRSKTVLTYYSNECQTQSFRSYYALLCFRFSSPSSFGTDQPIRDCTTISVRTIILWLRRVKTMVTPKEGWINFVKSLLVRNIVMHPLCGHRSFHGRFDGAATALFGVDVWNTACRWHLRTCHCALASRALLQQLQHFDLFVLSVGRWRRTDGWRSGKRLELNH